jgi:hypothetical protein
VVVVEAAAAEAVAAEAADVAAAVAEAAAGAAAVAVAPAACLGGPAAGAEFQRVRRHEGLLKASTDRVQAILRLCLSWPHGWPATLRPHLSAQHPFKTGHRLETNIPGRRHTLGHCC